MESSPEARRRFRVLVVDDHEVVREGLIAALPAHGYEVVGAAATAADALSLARSSRPDVALVDLRLPDLSGDDLCRRLCDEVPGLAVIMLTTYLSEETVRRALHSGAAAYVTKAAGLPELLDALERTTSATAQADPGNASQIVRDLHELTARRMEAVPLTPQQESVLELAAQGMTNEEIGRRLFITESTVRFHLQKLKATFGARSKTDLIARAIRTGASVSVAQAKSCSAAIRARVGGSSAVSNLP